MEGFHVIVNPERGSQQNRKSMRFFQFVEFWNLGNWINEIKSEEMRDASCGPVRLLLFRLFLPGIIGESGYNDNNNNNEFPSAFMVRDEGFEKWWLILTRRHTTVVDCLYHIIHWLSMQVRCTEKTKQKSRIKTRSLVAIFQKKKKHTREKNQTVRSSSKFRSTASIQPCKQANSKRSSFQTHLPSLSPIHEEIQSLYCFFLSTNKFDSNTNNRN